ncbi:hypothetical protein [Methylophilus sp.]|uniref:hypothetical protein n=1 Tax=Methylophilus sp. TaxID=29541 RepID=UPI0039C963D3
MAIIKVDASDAAVQLQFNVKADIDPMKLINLLQPGKRCRMNGPDKLRMTIQIGNLAHKTSVVKALLSQFS